MATYSGGFWNQTGSGTGHDMMALSPQGVQAGLDAGQNQLNRTSQQQIAQGYQQAQELPAQLQQQRFNTVFPWLQNAFGTLSQSLLGQNGQGGGAGSGQPAINAGPVWNQNQIQNQVNTARAQNDAQTATNIRGAQQGLAGRGFSGQSPLSQELAAQYQGQGLQANNAAQQGIQWNAAQGNAQQVLQGQQARQAQYQSNQQNLIQRQQIAAQQNSALLSALAGLA